MQKYALNVHQNAVLNMQEYAQYANKYMQYMCTISPPKCVNMHLYQISVFSDFSVCYMLDYV